MSDLGNKARSAVIWSAAFNLFRDLMHFAVMRMRLDSVRPGEVVRG